MLRTHNRHPKKKTKLTESNHTAQQWPGTGGPTEEGKSIINSE